MKNTRTADTSAQKNFSWPRPSGCAASGPRRPRTSPTLSSTWLTTPETEWIVPANSVGEPVTAQPKPLAAAIAVLVAMEIETEDDIAPRYQRIKCASRAAHRLFAFASFAAQFRSNLVLYASHLRLTCVSARYPKPPISGW